MTQYTRYVIPVTGVPGTGKTEASTLLSRLLGCRYVNSSSLLRRHGLAERDPTGRMTMIVDVDRLGEAVDLLLKAGECIVLETLYPVEWLEAGLEDHVPVILLLRTHPLTLYERLKRSRPDWPRDKIVENVLAESHNVVAEELADRSHYVVEVDTTRLSPAEAVDVFFEKLEAWDTGVRIDWIARDPGLVEAVSRWSMSLDLDKYRLGY